MANTGQTETEQPLPSWSMTVDGEEVESGDSSKETTWEDLGWEWVVPKLEPGDVVGVRRRCRECIDGSVFQDAHTITTARAGRMVFSSEATEWLASVAANPALEAGISVVLDPPVLTLISIHECGICGGEGWTWEAIEERRKPPLPPESSRRAPIGLDAMTEVVARAVGAVNTRDFTKTEEDE